jgi:MerR family transcriptional regulator/heat shock protein HspR
MIDPGGAGGEPAPPRPELRFPGDADPLYSVSQAAELLGVQPAFLRRLEAHDAVMPQRTAGGQRRYSRREVERIDAINGLIAEGMTLAGAIRIMALQAEIAELHRRLTGAGDPDMRPPEAP